MLRRLAGREERWTLANPPELAWDVLGGNVSSAGVSVTQDSALSLDAVWACITLLARSIATMPLIVYRGDGRERERARDSWQWQLLHERPNRSFAPDAFIEDVVAMLNTWGNWYGEKVRGRDESGRRVVSELWRIDPRKVRVSMDRQGNKRFEIDGEPRTLGADQVLHIPGAFYDGLYGLSPISVHREGLGSELARDEWSARWYGNSANPSGVLQTEGKLDSDAAARLKASWDAAHKGAANFGRTAVLEGGVTWKQMGMPQRDQQFVEQARFGVARVARIFQVPPEKIGGERSTNTYANIAAAGLDFVVYSLLHWMRRIEQALKHDQELFPAGHGLYPEFLAEGLLRGDPTTRGQFYEAMTRVGATVPNEIRENENLPPLEGGDEVVPAPGAAQPSAAASANGNGKVAGDALKRSLSVGESGDLMVVNVPPDMAALADGFRELAEAQRNQAAPVVYVNPPSVTVEAAQVSVTPEITLQVPKRNLTIRREDGTNTRFVEEDE